MATTPMETAVWDNDEDKVFEELQIASTDITQRLLVRGIRAALGKLVAANLEIVKALNEPGSGDLAKAQTLLTEVAGSEPPRCKLPGGG